LGERLGLRTSEDQPAEQLAALTVAEVASRTGHRLLVFDNVEEPDSVRDLLPATGTAKVLVTTNRRDVTTMADMTVIEVGMFTPQQGRALLSAATGLPDTDDTQAVGEMLGWLPLGTSQAGAYIRLNTITYRQYLRRLDRVDVDEALVRLAGTPHVGVLQAVALSMDTADGLDQSGRARKVLSMLSMLAPEGTPRAWLARPEALARLGIEPAGMDKALTVLTNTSLITQTVAVNKGQQDAGQQDARSDQDTAVVGVHRLIAKIVRHHAATAHDPSYEDAIDAAAAVLQVGAGELPRHQVALRRGELEQLVTHILAVRSHTQRYTASLDWLGDWAANNLKDVGDFSRAISIHRTLLTESQQALGDDHIDTLTSRQNLATACWSAGRHDEAMALYERNLADRERVLGADHHHTLTSRHSLAVSYRSAGRHDEAIALHERTLADHGQVLGADHPDTLSSRHSLATAYWSTGRNDEATALYERNLADRERVLGADHPHTLNSRHNLATAYWSAGRKDEAIALLERTLEDRERVLGADHPDTLNSRHNLAAAYRSAGR
jgi:tetratricopeptide (TPR) repeat protein